jgi:hypothetical protein
MKKNHKMLYMILAVLLVSFLFFGSREKNVVEGIFGIGDDDDDDDDGNDDHGRHGNDDDGNDDHGRHGRHGHDDDDDGNGIGGVFGVGKNNKISCKKYRFDRDKGVLQKLEAMMTPLFKVGAAPGVDGEGKPYHQGPENCEKFKELKTNVKNLLDELNKIDDH